MRGHIGAGPRAARSTRRAVIEAALSVFRESSELSRINRRAGQSRRPASGELFALLTRLSGVSLGQLDGQFDRDVDAAQPLLGS
jgi:thiamine biosynthesis lipoprotein ApbE